MTRLDYLRYMSPALLVASGILGLVLGGTWVWLGFGAFLLVAAIDPLLGKDHGMRRGAHPLLADTILYFQVVPVALLWVAFAWRVGSANAALTALDYLGAAVSVAFMTAIGGLPAAHEMFHRHSALGKFVGSALGTIFASGYSSLAHVHVHHIDTDTTDDTETPRRGESVYRFVVRAAYRQHRRSWQIEMARLRKLGLGFWNHLTPRPAAPQMPSAVTCFVLALIPPLWEKLIGRPLLRHWDTHHATARERELAIAANRAAGWPDWLSDAPMPSAA